MSVLNILRCSGVLQKVKFLPSLSAAVNSYAFLSSQSAEEFVENVVKRKLENALQPEFIEVINESTRHNVPRGSASHIRVTIVSPMFNSKNLVQRHRLVMAALQEELKGPIHALAIDAISSTEVKGKVESQESPTCRGGSKL
ncbi:hypothetical protein JTE90_028869 [Oedothorax gibbosus]|uniref:BolA-like protein n=1 Tax=Oedothorax gibbosus TaxID=931172 RepID=A0AAV6U8N2_9ARAC|nr:hypothetical protein JTE90_028869 [Oedothorax gibbosus]